MEPEGHNEVGSDAQRREFLTGLGTRARSLAWSPWGELAKTLRESWEGALRSDGVAEGATVPWDRLGPPRVLLRSGEPMTVTGVGFPPSLSGAVFYKRADAILQEWILAAAGPDAYITVAFQRRGGDGPWQHQVDSMSNRFFPAGTSSGAASLCVSTPWFTAVAVNAEGFLVEWDSRGAGVLRREGLGALFGGMTPVGFFGRSGQSGAFYFFGSGSVMKVLTRGFFDGRALTSNRGLLSAGRVFVAKLVEGHGQWRGIEDGAGTSCVPADIVAASAPPAQVVSVAVDPGTGALYVERKGGWLRIVDDGTAVHAAMISEDAVPMALRSQCTAWTGDAALMVATSPYASVSVRRLLPVSRY